MSDTPLDERRAWTLIRHATRLDWSMPAAVYSEAGVTCRQGGHWQATGMVTPEAALLLDRYLPLTTVPAPFVLAQLGQSVDGRIATACGHSHYVTGPESLVHLHRLRALVDAVIVGAGTVAADDPQLTVRHVEGDNPVRVVLDPRGRLDATMRVFRDPAAPTLHVVVAGSRGHTAGGAAHVERLTVSDNGAGIAPQAVLDALAARGLKRVLVEGGGLTVSRFLEAGCLHRLQVTVAPLLIGSGRPAVTLPEITTLHEALRPPCRTFSLGEDVLFDFTLNA